MLRALHERNPVRIRTLAGLVSKQRLVISQRENVTHRHLNLVPFEDQDSFWLEHSKALRKAAPKVFFPVIT